MSFETVWSYAKESVAKMRISR